MVMRRRQAIHSAISSFPERLSLCAAQTCYQCEKSCTRVSLTLHGLKAVCLQVKMTAMGINSRLSELLTIHAALHEGALAMMGGSKDAPPCMTAISRFRISFLFLSFLLLTSSERQCFYRGRQLAQSRRHVCFSCVSTALKCQMPLMP